MVKNTRRAITLFVATVAFVLQGAGGPHSVSAADSDAATSLNLRISFAPEIDTAPFYAAMTRFWPKLGLHVNVLPGKGSAAAVQSAGAGTDQVALVDFSAAVNGIRQGVPITIIAVAQGRDPSAVIFTAKSGVRNWADLKGKRIGFLPGAASGLEARAALKARGIDPDSADWQAVPPGAQLSLLRAGTLQLATGYGGAQDVQLNCFGIQAGSLRAYDAGIKSIGQVIVVNNDWAKKVGPDVVSKFLLGAFQGYLLLKTDPGATLAELAKQNPDMQFDLPSEFAEMDSKHGVWPFTFAPIDNARGFGWLDSQHVAAAIDTLQSAGVLTADPNAPNASGYFTTRYLDNRDVQAVAHDYVRHGWLPVPQKYRDQCGLN